MDAEEKWRPEGPATWTAQPLLFPAPAPYRSQPLRRVVGLSARHPGSEGWWGRHVGAEATSVAFPSYRQVSEGRGGGRGCARNPPASHTRQSSVLQPCAFAGAGHEPCAATEGSIYEFTLKSRVQCPCFTSHTSNAQWFHVAPVLCAFTENISLLTEVPLARAAPDRAAAPPLHLVKVSGSHSLAL